MRIGVDLDGTIAATWEAWVEELRKDGYDVPDDPDMGRYGWEATGWYNFGPLSAEEIQAWADENEFRIRTEIDTYPGVPAILAILDHEFIAITARRLRGGDFCEETAQWLRERGLPIQKLIHAEDKTTVCKEELVDVLIEDAPYNAQSAAHAGIPVLLYDQYYNQGFDHPLVFRFSHWLEVPLLLKRLESGKLISSD